MANIPQSYINSLISLSDWETLFDGSVVSLVGMNFAADGSNTGAYGDTPYPDNFRYLSYTTTNYAPVNGHTTNVDPIGGVWDTTLNDNSKWMLMPVTGTLFWTLVPFSSQNVALSWDKGGDYPSQLCFTGGSPSAPNVTQYWTFEPVGPATWNGVSYTAMSLRGAFFQITDGIDNAYTSIQYSNLGLITTGKVGSAQLLLISKPGDKLLNKFCSDTTNLSTQVCVNYCSLSVNNCKSTLSAYCNGAALQEASCIDYCENKNNNCDIQLQTYCAQLLSDSGLGVGDFLANPDYANICGCFMAANVYSSFSQSLINLTGTLPPGDTKNCYFPFCTSASLHSYDWKNSPYCPSTVNCVNVVNINNGGNIDKVSINQSNKSCKSLVPGGDKGGSTTDTGTGKIGKLTKNGDRTTFIIIAVVIGMGVLAGLGYLLKKSHSKKRK